MYLLILAAIIGFACIIFLYPLRTTNKWAKKAQNWLISRLCWNFLIRVFIEVSLELAFGVMLNYPFLGNYYTFETFYEGLDYIMTIILGSSLLFMPLFITLFFQLNFEHLEDPDF